MLPSRERALDQLRDLTRLQISDLGLHYQAIAAACASVAARRSDAADMEILRSFIPAGGGGSADWRLALSEFLLEVAAIARSARLARELIAPAGRPGHPHAPALRGRRLPQRRTRILEDIAAAVEAHRPAAAEAGVKALITATTDWLLTEQSKRY